jgi:large subunit ribosomal protein L21
MAFAVIETGGKQYRVSPGSLVEIEKLEGEAGSSVTFTQVLMYQDGPDPVVGAPFVDGVTVTGEVVAQVKGDKIRVFTYKPKKRQRRTLGHRQQLTQVKIKDIVAAKAKTSKTTEK